MPLNLNNNEVTGVDLNNTEVSEVRLNGDTVFSAGASLQDIVAPGNLVAWYPFENQAVDETRTGGILDNAGISVGDSSDYSGSVSGATYQSSGGVTDINSGPNSGAFDFGGPPSGDLIDTFINPSGGTGDFNNSTITIWVNPDQTGTRVRILSSYDGDGGLNNGEIILGQETAGWEFTAENTSGQIIADNFGTEVASPTFLSMVLSGNDVLLYENGNLKLTVTYSNTAEFSGRLTIGEDQSGARNNENFSGLIDDVRFYNKSLSGGEINQIYQNTEP